MKKLRSDALWHKFTPEQQDKIQHWFFVEHLSYTAVHARIRDEFGIKCSRSILSPMYQHCKELRSHEREAMLQKLTEVITEPGADVSRVQNDTLTLITGRLLHRSLVHGDTAEVAALARVMFQGESRAIERDRLDLAREQLEWRRAQSAPASTSAVSANEGL
ncbi:MAG: hypothetical protein JWQ04_716 [Pedosphaera sp.]|nr:hypothetical protein [Pedosphaera sp.]